VNFNTFSFIHEVFTIIRLSSLHATVQRIGEY